MSIYTAWHFSRVTSGQMIELGRRDRDRGPAGRPTVRVSPFERVSQVSQGLLIATTSKAKRSEVSGQRLGLSRPS